MSCMTGIELDLHHFMNDKYKTFVFTNVVLMLNFFVIRKRK